MTAPRRTLQARLTPPAVFVVAVVIVFAAWIGQVTLSGWIIWAVAAVIIVSIIATECGYAGCDALSPDARAGRSGNRCLA